MLKHTETVEKDRNILIIMTDQQRADAVGYVNDSIYTPNLNRLANKSIICTKAFVQSPQCQPSRASILTGRYPSSHKVWWNETKLSKSEITIGNMFENAGYKTGYFGKLHITTDLDHTSTARHFGFNNTYLSEDWRAETEEKKETKRARMSFNAPMKTKNWTGTIENEKFHHDNCITNRAIDFIKSSHEPYIAIVSYNGPHPPYAAPDEFSSLYNSRKFSVPRLKSPNLVNHVLSDEEWMELKKQYYGAVSWIDSYIGKILSVIDDNTIVIFMSDHGDILGDHGLFSKGIFAYDGNTHIPLLFSIPGLNNGAYNNLVQSIDVLPTLLDLTNIPLCIGIQGKSLLNNFKYGGAANKSIISMIGYTDRLKMIRTDSYKYWICGANEYLFDLKNDADEEHNLSYNSKYTSLLYNARFEMMKAIIAAEDPLPAPDIKSFTG